VKELKVSELLLSYVLCGGRTPLLVNQHLPKGKQYGSSRQGMVPALKKHFMGHGRLDSALGSYSIPGIDFFPKNRP
jgi:hypothetical protein